MSSIRPDLKFQDDRDQSSFYKRYLNLPTQPQRTLRIVDKTEYFILFDQDAEIVADLIYKTQSVVKTSRYQHSGTKTYIQYLTLSPAVFANLIKIVIFELGYKLEIYDKNWGNCKNASPGNLTEIELLLSGNDELAASDNGSVIASLKLVSSSSEGKKIGLSFYEPNDKYFGMCEFVDNELYTHLESVLVQLGVKECLVPSVGSPDPDFEKVKGLIDRCDIVITDIKSSEFSDKTIEQDLVGMTGNELVLSTNELSSMKISLGCVNSLISYLSLLSDDSNRGQFSIGRYNLEQYMRLDFAAIKALNLFPPPNYSNSMNKNSSVFGLLNHCKTNGGSRLLSQWLKQPLVDVDEINKRHLIVKLLMDDMNLRINLQNEFLKEVPDVVKLLRKLHLKRGSSSKLDDVIRLYQLCVKLPDALGFLNDAIEELSNQNDNEEEVELTKSLIQQQWIDPITEHSTALANYQSMIEQTVDLKSLDQATSASNNMIAINPEYDDNLMEISGKLDKLDSKIKEIHSDTADDLNVELKKLKLEDHHVHGQCFRLTRGDASCLRGNKKYRELSTVKAGVFFTTSELNQVSDDAKSLREDYEKFQKDIVNEIVDTASTYSPVFTKLSIVLSQLDVLVSFAHASSFAPIQYVRPNKLYGLKSSARNLKLIEARHPCLEQQDNLTFISNDIIMSREDSEFLIITGPNMGGKSTYIRTVGVIALMNQIGCFIPVSEDDENEICIFDSILARVGASDSQLKGVSTFMSEMLEMSSILKTATENSLIIVDELGRGTSTYDGFGLAWSISEFIASKIKAFTLFATHFHELTSLSEQINTVKNYHVVAHVESTEKERGTNDNITLLYKVEPGISDQSFGIHVAELVKFPKKIIEMSKRKALELDDSTINEEERNKRVKFSNEEVLKSRELFITILKKWKQAVKEKGGLDKMDSEDAVEELKKLVEGEYKNEFSNDKVLQEMLKL